MSLIADMIRPKRSGTYNPERWLIDWVNGGAPTSSGVNVNENTALKYTPFWACVRVISGTLASLPFIVYRRLQEGKERVNSHPVYRLLHDRPNEFMDTITFIETRQAHVLTYGNGYAEIQRDNGGRPIVLWPLLPDRTFRKISDGGIPYYEVHPSTGEVVHLPDHNVLHIKGLGFDGYTGYNVVSYHKEAIGYGIAVKEYGSRFFGSGASPGGVLEHPSTLSDAAAKRLSDSWDKGSSGLTHAHRTRILEEGMKWTPIGVEPEHAQALEVQKYTVDDCSRIFNIPPHKIGSLERATFCLPADVEVYTENGNKSIADVIAGENVWSLSNNDEWVLSPVLRSECTGVDDILHIRTSNRAIRANAKHKILVRRKYNRPKQGKGGRQWNEWVSEYVPAGDLKVGDVLVAYDGGNGKNGNPFNRKNRKYPWHGGRGFDVKGCSLSRITSITKEPPEKVYDLEVAGTHSFIANGVVVHNSNIEEQNLDFVTQTMLYWFRKWEQECNYKLFMPSETSRMFCEILADGLLRGNLKSRYEAYNIGRNGGWLSADDIREKENMNPLPDGKGKIYLEPLNMKEAGTEPEPTDDDVRQAHYDLIRSQVDRVLTKQKNTGNPDYEWAEKILNGPVTAWASLSGVSGLVASRLLSFVLQKELSTDDADKITDLIMKKIQGVNYVN